MRHRVRMVEWIDEWMDGFTTSSFLHLVEVCVLARPLVRANRWAYELTLSPFFILRALQHVDRTVKKPIHERGNVY